MTVRGLILPVLAMASALAMMPAHASQPEAAEQQLEAVVVTAQRIRDQLEAERAVTPGAVTNLDGSDFHERSVVQLADMMRYVPGVYAESYNGNDEVFYSSRGSNLDATDYDKNGIKFLQDGLPITAADGAIVGLLAGLIGATCQFVLSIPIGLLVGPVERQLLERLREMSGSGVAEFNLNRGPGLIGTVLLRLIAFVFTLIVGAIVSTLAGVVGAVLFAKPAPVSTPNP